MLGTAGKRIQHDKDDGEQGKVDLEKKRCTDRKAAHFSALNCAEQRNPPEKERRGRGPSRWQGTVATVTQRGENNEGLEWCFMSHQDAATRPMSLNGNAAVSQKTCEN